MSVDEFYKGRRVMITGGLGFIGSNLAHALAQRGADVLLVDSLIPEYGGNLFNIAGITDRVRVNVAEGTPLDKVANAIRMLADNGYPDAFVDMLYVTTGTDAHLEWVERLVDTTDNFSG